MISSSQVFLNSSSGSWSEEHFTVGHEDVTALMFNVHDERKRKKCISIDQKLSVSELE